MFARLTEDRDDRRDKIIEYTRTRMIDPNRSFNKGPEFDYVYRGIGIFDHVEFKK